MDKYNAKQIADMLNIKPETVQIWGFVVENYMKKKYLGKRTCVF